MNFSGSSFSEGQYHGIVRSTESNFAFKSRKTETLGLRHMCLCLKICRNREINKTTNGTKGGLVPTHARVASLFAIVFLFVIMGLFIELRNRNESLAICDLKCYLGFETRAMTEFISNCIKQNKCLAAYWKSLKCVRIGPDPTTLRHRARN